MLERRPGINGFAVLFGRTRYRDDSGVGSEEDTSRNVKKHLPYLGKRGASSPIAFNCLHYITRRTR